MQKLQDSVFSIVKTTNLSPAVFSYLQPSEDFPDKSPLGGILSDTKHGWLALGPKFCVVDLRTGLKVAARTFGVALSNFRTTVTSVVELPSPLTDYSQQLIISLECEDIAGMICVFHINGSQILRCIQTEIVVTELAVCDGIPDGPFTCFDGVIMAGTKSGEIFVFDLNRASLIQALKDISQGYEHMIRNEENAANITFLPLNAVPQIEEQRDLAIENEDHIAVLLNENSLADTQYIFRNPDGTVRMKAKRDHVRVTVLQYIPQLGSLAVGYNFGAFQIWNLMNMDLEFTSQINVECLPVTHFGFQEPCDDPRAFCYLWVVFSVMDRFDEEEFPLAVMYSLTYQGKRMLSSTKCLYQEFLTATVRFQVELSTTEENAQLVGGRCISCHTYSVNSGLGGEGEDSMLNICQLVWECWGDNVSTSAQHGLLLFDLDQWYKDQMPATYQLQSNAFMSATCCTEVSRGACATLDVRLAPASVCVYSARAATRLEEHFYPNSLHYNCICLNTSEACVLSTIGIQRQIINSMDEIGPTALLNPTRLYNACVATGLTPLYTDSPRSANQEEQRRYLLSVALEARLSKFLKRCAHDWATGSHGGAGCTLTFLVDWCWQRAIELKENARELTAPLFTSSAIPDRNLVRCLDHCVQQLTELTGLLDAVLTKCCNLVVPDALSEMEEKHKGIGTVSLYFQVVQWFLGCGLLPERNEACTALPYPGGQLTNTYTKRRVKLQRLQERAQADDGAAGNSCALLYIDQLIEHEFGGESVHQTWVRGGSECHGLYPPPSLYSLLRLYLLPHIAEEHKHSLVLYLLVDYSMVYDEVRYEAVIRRLMQFPTMFGLSNTAIKATQAFWHLDHRDFDFALDQLQCLTGNTLSEWQHNVVLSSLLAQKKTQAALQYLHVRKPPPIQNIRDDMNRTNNRVNDHDKLDDWQSCCNLYLARGLVFEALDVIRMCVQNAGSLDDKAQVLGFFFKGCRNMGHLSKILQITLLPFEEEVFIRYLENCDESQTSDILIMYYLQQARYLEAERYNTKIKQSKARPKDLSTSIESLVDVMDRESARDTLVEVVCSSLPNIANTVAHCALDRDTETHVIAPRPMSVFIQAKSPKNTFTYKSSFIQDTIENASETWMNKPKMRRGLKRALNIEDTPFICTPKLSRNRSILSEQDSTPSKRPRLDLSGTPRTPAGYPSERLSKQMSTLLEMPEMHSPDMKLYERSGADTPHSILKIRPEAGPRDAPSPCDSRYLGESDDDMLETASNHTHYSDSTNKHLRFTIPTASESGSTPSPPPIAPAQAHVRKEARETEPTASTPRQKEMDVSIESYATTESHHMNAPHPLESPPKKFATAENVNRKPYKDIVRGRRSLSISANSSLSDDPNTSVESIADIPITLINPRYSGERRRYSEQETREKYTDVTQEEKGEDELSKTVVDVPKTPRSRKGIRISGESTPLMNRSRSVTPERQDSPATLRPLRMTRSRSRTPDLSPRSSPLDPIAEQPRQEMESQAHPVRTALSAPRMRSRSRTPERIEKVLESPRLEAITESPTKSPDSPPASPTRRSLRSRSRTPEVEVPAETTRPGSPRSLRPRAKTPEKLMSPKKDHPKSTKKSLSRLVLEANAFAKTKQNTDKEESETIEPSEIIECTPMKALKPVPNLMDVTISPIASKSILQSSNESLIDTGKDKTDETPEQTTPAFTLNETEFGKSVLHSYDSTVTDTSNIEDGKGPVRTEKLLKAIPFSLSESCFGQSVLHSYQSSIAESSIENEAETDKIDLKPSPAVTSFNFTGFDRSVLSSAQSSAVETSNEVSSEDKLDKEATTKPNMSSLMTSDSDIDVTENDQWKTKMDGHGTAASIQKEKEKIVEIEREIHEIEGDMSDDVGSDGSGSEDDGDSVDDESGIDEAVEEEDSDEQDIDSDDESKSSNEAEVISINDTDSDNSSDSLPLTIDTQSTDTQPVPTSVENQVAEVNIENEEMVIDKEDQPIDNTDETGGMSGTDPLNQALTSIMTDDNSVRDESDMKHTDEKNEEAVRENIDSENKEVPMETESAPQLQIIVEVAPTDSDQIEITKESPQETELTETTPEDVVDATSTIKTNIQELAKGDLQLEAKVSEDKDNIIIELVPKSTDDQSKEQKDEEIVETISETPGDDKNEKSEVKLTIDKPVPRSRKRVKSTSSNKESDIEKREQVVDTENVEDKTEKVQTKTDKVEGKLEQVKDTTEKDEPQTPTRRKRSQSVASNKSTTETEQKTPESDNNTELTTPSRRKARTPSTEVRKILTRRASKEQSVISDDSQVIPEESVLDTPKRRSTRSRSKNIDDNASIASESSVRSTRSKASEDVGDIKAAQVRKGRKSAVAKPELSVIPETTVEESSSKFESNEELMKEYSMSRRLTRHQRSMLESWLEPRQSPLRRSSRSSVVSLASDGSPGDVSPTHSAFDVQPIDRISLMNKGDFAGSPDPSEQQSTISPLSVASDAAKQTPRMARALSEAKTTPKAAKINRRMSVDVVDSGWSPIARGRRASFNRACEALLTPKARRTSTDLRKGDTSSQHGSPESDAAVTPSRRGRRASTQSNTSQTKASTSKRSKKLSAVDENKDTK